MKKPTEPDWDALPSVSGYLNVFFKDEDGRLGYWRRHYVRCDKFKVEFFDFIQHVKILLNDSV